MFRKLIIDAFPALVNFFNSLNITGQYFSKPQIKNMKAFIVAMMLDGFRGKLVNVSNFSLNTTHSSISRFLNNKNWDDKELINLMQEFVINQIWQRSRTTGLPIYVIIDDTLAEKTKPSSKASHPTIAGCEFHRSHLKKQTVYGHQFVCVMLQCGELILPFTTVLYEKKDSKIQIVKEIIMSLPAPVNEGFVLSDSWYSCEELFKVAESRHFHYIGAMRTNRKIFPRSHSKNGIQILDFVRTLPMRCFDLVTIKGHKYWVYIYTGKIKGMNRVKIVISYPYDSWLNNDAVKVFVCTQPDLSAEKILTHYSKRWPIEVFFRESNRCLGMKKIQVRSLTAIRRYQYLIMLAYIFCGLESNGNTLGFSNQRYIYQKEIEIFKIKWIYDQAKQDTDIEQILSEFRLSA